MARKLFLLALTIVVVLLGPSVTSSADDQPGSQPQGTRSDYVGSETCALCHANTFATFKQTWHQMILRPTESVITLGDFSSQDPDLTFTLDDVEWVLGGQYKQRYLTEIDGELYVLPAEWNLQTGEWVAYEVEDWRSRRYSQYCAGCHTTGYDATTQTWVEPGVGCEACHGPGADHVAATGDRARIINPAELLFQDQVEVCAQCHSRGEDPSGEFPFPVGYVPGGPAELSQTFVLSTDMDDFWPDGTAKRHHMQYQDWRQGTHQDSVGCIFCHTSHSVGETDHQTRMVGNDRCLVCHEGNRDLITHIPFMASAVDEVTCMDCHMPQVSKLLLTDFQIRSHTFRPPDPSISIAYGGQEQMPNSCNICHTDNTPEWAAMVLNQEISYASATRVPVPTSPPLPSGVVTQVGDRGSSETVLHLKPQPRTTNSWLWGLGFIVLVGVLVAAWTYRKVKQA